MAAPPIPIPDDPRLVDRFVYTQVLCMDVDPATSFAALFTTTAHRWRIESGNVPAASTYFARNGRTPPQWQESSSPYKNKGTSVLLGL